MIFEKTNSVRFLIDLEDGKVYYDQFFKLISGNSLAPIG